MNLPTDLPREIAERTQQPGFDAVLTRADHGRRRRRTTIASGLAAAVVVAGVAFAAAGPLATERSAPEPATPGLTEEWDGTAEVDPRLPAEVQEVLSDDQVDVLDVAGSDAGAVAALWAACSGGSGAHLEGCRSALVVSDGKDVHGVRIDGDPPVLTPVAGGWLVSGADGPVLVDATGAVRPVVTTGGNGARTEPGDTALPSLYGQSLLRGTEILPLPSPRDLPTTGAYVAPTGRLVVATTGIDGTAPWASDDGTAWDGSILVGTDTATPLLAGRGDHVAMVLLGDAPDGSIPVLSVHLSHDVGRTWTRVDGLAPERGDLPSNVSSATVMPDGTTYLATESHHVLRIDPDGNVLPIQLSSSDRSVFAIGDVVCAVSEAGRYDQLYCSTDGGTGWSPRPLPGLR